MKKSTKALFILALILVLAGIFSGVYMYNKPHKNYAKAGADIVAEAVNIIDEYNSNESESNKKYLGKLIEITGRIVDVQKDENGSVSVFLEDSMFGLTCNFDAETVKKQQELIDALSPGQVVCIKGKCDGILTDVRLSKCIIVSK